jgi:hypothetical protein
LSEPANAREYVALITACTSTPVTGCTDEGLSASEVALARWARRVTADPNSTTAGDVVELRGAGYADRQIVATTCFVALRMAFSTVNDALGARPDHELGESVPAEVRDVVTWGRPVGSQPMFRVGQGEGPTTRRPRGGAFPTSGPGQWATCEGVALLTCGSCDRRDLRPLP